MTSDFHFTKKILTKKNYCRNSSLCKFYYKKKKVFVKPSARVSLITIHIYRGSYPEGFEISMQIIYKGILFTKM